MAFFYVKNTGTAAASSDSGRAATARTGSWNTTTSEFYATLADATSGTKTTPPVSGDVIVWSDASSEAGGSYSEFVPAGMHIMVVDDSNQEQYKQATTSQYDSSTYFRPIMATNATAASVYSGCNWTAVQDVLITSTGGRAICRDLTIGNTHPTLGINFIGKSSTSLIINPDFSTGTSANMAFAGLSVRCYGGVMTVGASASTVVELMEGPNVAFIGVDFSANATSKVLAEWSTSATEKAGNAHFVHCDLHTGWSFANLSSNDAYCGIVEACDSRYQYYEESRRGEIDFVTDIYYTTHDTLDDGSTRGSYEFETNASTDSFLPLMLGAFYWHRQLSAVNTEAATKKKVRLRFATASGQTLDSGDLYVLVASTNASVAWHRDIVEHWIPDTQSGTALSTETGAWTGSGLGTQYYLDVDMGNPGNGRVAVVPGVCKPNVTVYFSWQLEFVA